MNLSLEILAIAAIAFAIAVFIVGIAHDPRVPRIGKVMMIILMAVIFSFIVSLF